MLPAAGGWTLRPESANGGEPLRIQMVAQIRTVLVFRMLKFFKIQLRDEQHDKELTG